MSLVDHNEVMILKFVQELHRRQEEKYHTFILFIYMNLANILQFSKEIMKTWG